MRRLLATTLLLAGLASASPVPAVLGHGGNGLNVYPPVAAPGDEVSIYASMLWTEQHVVVTLLAIDGTQWVLGETTTDGAGDLNFSGRIPDGLPDATYSIRAAADSGDDAHARIDLVSPGPPALLIAAAAGVVVAILLPLAVAVIRQRRRLDPDA